MERSNYANPIGDADFYFGGLQVGDRSAAGVERDEINGGAERSFACDLRGRDSDDEANQRGTQRQHVSFSVN